MNWTPLVLVGLPIGILVFFLFMSARAAAKRAQARKEMIYRKYGRNQIAEHIIAQKLWVGENETQLIDSLGRPEDTDEKVLKTKSKVIWKYHHRGANRYGLRVTVENGVVVGWDEKL
jgi:hypothetical protein